MHIRYEFRRTDLFPFLCVVTMLAAGCAGSIPAFLRPDVSPQTRVVSAAENFSAVLHTLDTWRINHLISDGTWTDVVKPARETGYSALTAAQTVVDIYKNTGQMDNQALADELDKLSVQLAILLNVKHDTAPAAQAKGLSVPKDPPPPPPVKAQSEAVLLILGLISAFLKNATSKANQAADEGRELTAQEIKDAWTGVDTTIAESRMLDKKQDT